MTMPSEYCSAPSQPGGVQSGQRPGPSCLENSTCTPLGRISTTRSAEVIGQLAMFSGELRMIADDSGIMSAAGDGAGEGDGDGLLLPPRRSVSVPPIGPKHELPVNTNRNVVASIG